MLIKAATLGLVVSTPLFIVADQDPSPVGTPTARLASSSQPQSTLSELQSLRDQVEALRAEVARAKEHCRSLNTQLGECMDMLQASVSQSGHRNCSPSRGSRRALMTQYQWMQRHGHQDRAEKTISRLIQSVGDKASNLNSFAWHLMTDTATAKQYDDIALAMAERMQKHRGSLRHQYVDTIALAKFLNGKVDEAIALQRQALRANKNSDDYRRRLRTYEAAKLVAAAPAAQPPRPAKLLNEE